MQSCMLWLNSVDCSETAALMYDTVFRHLTDFKIGPFSVQSLQHVSCFVQSCRLWLGTFDSAEEAALAYDAATSNMLGNPLFSIFPAARVLFCAELQAMAGHL